MGAIPPPNKKYDATDPLWQAVGGESLLS